MKTMILRSAMPLFVVVSAAASQAAAQTTPTIERCAQIVAQAERLACYDAIARNPAAPATQTQPSAESPAPAQPSAEKSRSEPLETTRSEPAETRSERRARQREERQRGVRELSIVAVSENFTGFLVFTADSGEVFVETSANAARYPDPPFQAVLEPASFGSYFLVPETQTNRIRVSLQR